MSDDLRSHGPGFQLIAPSGSTPFTCLSSHQRVQPLEQILELLHLTLLLLG
jgi:hypothetical protein